MSDLRAVVGNAIRNARTEQKLTQDDLAERAGTSRSSIANIETGRQNIGIDQLARIAHALRLPLPALLGGPSDWAPSTASDTVAEDLLNEIVVAATPFLLRRHTDVSGVSGTGVVADGVIFPAAGKGVAVTRWRGDRGSTVVWDNLTHLTEIHGHGGATTIEVVPVAALVECLRSLIAQSELFELNSDEIRAEIVRHLAPNDSEDSDAV